MSNHTAETLAAKTLISHRATYEFHQINDLSSKDGLSKIVFVDQPLPVHVSYDRTIDGWRTQFGSFDDEPIIIFNSLSDLDEGVKYSIEHFFHDYIVQPNLNDLHIKHNDTKLNALFHLKKRIESEFPFKIETVKPIINVNYPNLYLRKS